MFTIKHYAVLFIVQNTVSSSYLPLQIYDTTTYPDSRNNSLKHVSDEFNKSCFEDHSLISKSDIKYLIDHKAEILKIEEKLVSDYYPEAELLFEKYMNKLEEYKEQLEDRPKHMLHLLENMAGFRKRLEEEVAEISFQLRELYTLENIFEDVAKHSFILLNQLEKYQNICKINCENDFMEYRSHQIIIQNPIVTRSVINDMYCVRLKDLNDYIVVSLSQVPAQYDKLLYRELQIKETVLEQKERELKTNLREVAVKEFGMKMYDILGLQDDYHHFYEELKDLNVSSEIQNIEKNMAEIKLRVIGLKREVNLYRQYCMKCNFNRRVKRNILESDHPYAGTQINDESNIVDELLQAKIDEIINITRSYFTNKFLELEEDLNHTYAVHMYKTNVHMIHFELERDIEVELAALNELRTRIPDTSISRMHALSKESKLIVDNLDSAKQFINLFISRYSYYFLN